MCVCCNHCVWGGVPGGSVLCVCVCVCVCMMSLMCAARGAVVGCDEHVYPATRCVRACVCVWEGGV